ncbi:hypothetical protein CLOM_g20124 [Closterium sp. NIES-68]|nr:hypothetical protein CLOM_g20124 [Closterium sp. NIES-68]
MAFALVLIRGLLGSFPCHNAGSCTAVYAAAAVVTRFQPGTAVARRSRFIARHAGDQEAYHHPVRRMASLQETLPKAAASQLQHDVSKAEEERGEEMSGGGEGEGSAQGGTAQKSEAVRGELAEAYEKDMEDYGEAYATRSADEGFGQIYGEPVTHEGVRGRVGNAPAAWTEEESKVDTAAEPAGREGYDRGQGAAVGETEVGCHATRDKAATQEAEGGAQGLKG